IHSIAVGPYDRVYTSSTGSWYQGDWTYYLSYVLALDPKDDSLAWYYQSHAPLGGLAVDAAGRVAVIEEGVPTAPNGDHSGVLSIAKGALQWHYYFPDEQMGWDHYGTPSLGADGAVYIPANGLRLDYAGPSFQPNGAKLYAINSNGSGRWQLYFELGDVMPN